MTPSLSGRSFLKLLDFTTEEIRYLLDLSADLKAKKRAGEPPPLPGGKNVALIFEKTSTRTRCAFEVGAADLGMHAVYLDPSASQIGKKESIADTARVLGRMFDGIEYRGFGQGARGGARGVRGRAGVERAHHGVSPHADARRRAHDGGGVRPGATWPGAR